MTMSTPDQGPKRVPCSVRLRRDIMDRAKQVARDYAGKPMYLTLSTLIENALIAEMDRIEASEETPTPVVRINRISGRLATTRRQS